MKNAVSELFKVIDSSDVMAFIGLSFIFYGVFMIHKPTAFVVIGVLLFGLAVIPSFRRGG